MRTKPWCSVDGAPGGSCAGSACACSPARMVTGVRAHVSRAMTASAAGSGSNAAKPDASGAA